MKNLSVVKNTEVAEVTELAAENYQEFLAQLAEDRSYWTPEEIEAQRLFDLNVAKFGSPV